MKVDVTEYRDRYLKVVEEHVIANKAQVPNYSSQGLHAAILSEMNRADSETWLVDVPDDKDKAIKEAESRVVDHMKHNVDLGVGKSF